jgi:peptide/nickel transport system ATP-binding protein
MSDALPLETPAALLGVRDLVVSFDTDAGAVNVVDGVSFDIFPGETLALVGESGSGKSVTAMSILRLIESQGGQLCGGSIRFEGAELTRASPRELGALRGRRIGVVFQEPMSSLNPVLTLGDQIAEPLMLHLALSRAQARDEAVHLLRLVNMPAPERRVDEYPYQVSGGMRQRAMIAMALACRPSLLIADEPTTALDVTVQAQILELLGRLQQELGMAILLITHDLGVVASVARRALVMYAGRIVEQADVASLFAEPRHPYTAGLLESLPRLDAPLGASGRLRPIDGNVPDARHWPTGCRFHPRCAFALPRCAEQPPELLPPRGVPPHSGRLTACWHSEQHPELSYLGARSPRGDPERRGGGAS